MHRTGRLLVALMVVGVVVWTVAGCGGGETGSSAIYSAAPEVTVSAADSLDAALAKADAGGRVFVVFDGKPDPAVVQRAGGKVVYTYHLVPAIAARGPGAVISKIAEHPRVVRIEPDRKVYAVDAELDNTWGVKRIGAGIVHDGGNKGTGVKVAVIDSGIDYTHPDLDGNYAGGYDFTNDDNDPMDDDGHGTHVAGTIAAEDNDVGVVGVAPEASLYGLKVLDSTGTGDYSDVIAALQWAVDNGIQVTNNSYGSSGDPGTAVKAAFDNAAAAGVLHIAAAGNTGNPPGRGDNVIFPARYESVIAVAATGENDKRARRSSTGPDVELAAPGVDINSTLLGGGYGGRGWSGTSMASPHVAGTAALVIAADVTDVRGQLQVTADDLGDAGFDPHYGYGLVDADEAAGIPENQPPTVSITSPADGSTFDSGATISFAGSATDPEDGDLTASLVWTSSIDGPIGTEGSFSTTLSDGTHTITAQVTDTGGKSGSDSIGITVGASAGGTGVIAGKVTNAAGKGIRGATVTVDGTGQSATANPAGRYKIQGVPAGEHDVTASATGYVSQSQPVTVYEGQTTTVNFALPPSG